MPALGKPSEGLKPQIFLMVWLSGMRSLTALGAQTHTSPLLCHVWSAISLFDLSLCSLKPCQSKRVLSVGLNDLFPGCLAEGVGASIQSSAC